MASIFGMGAIFIIAAWLLEIMENTHIAIKGSLLVIWLIVGTALLLYFFKKAAERIEQLGLDQDIIVFLVMSAAYILLSGFAGFFKIVTFMAVSTLVLVATKVFSR